jgi:hypothetical protein
VLPAVRPLAVGDALLILAFLLKKDDAAMLLIR